MPLCFVSIGSNVDRERNVRSALRALREQFGPLLVSAVYDAPAIGFDGAPFFNLVVGFWTNAPAATVATVLSNIETAHGRTRSRERLAPRTLDLDLLLYDDAVMHEAGLQLPRPEIEQYAFVIEPLAEIAPDLAHPRSGRRYRDLCSEVVPARDKLTPVAMALDD